MVMFGEIGLSGEIRPIQNGLERLNEAAKHGFKQALIPSANKPKELISKMDVQTVTHISQVMEKVGL
jgi:DNA repair protein RadA/Sms